MESLPYPVFPADIEHHPGYDKLGSLFGNTYDVDSQARKVWVMESTRAVLLEKLCTHSRCAIRPIGALGLRCPCVGWRPYGPNEEKPDGLTPNACNICFHDKDDHISHIRNLPDKDLRQLMSYFVDAETLNGMIGKEADDETKAIFVKVRDALLKAGRELRPPNLARAVGPQNVHDVTLAKGMKKMMEAKREGLGDTSQFMFEVMDQCVILMGYWHFQTNVMKPRLTSDEFKQWMAMCHVPIYCDSLPLYNESQVFGQAFFSKTFELFKNDLMAYLRRSGGIVGYNGYVIPRQVYSDFLELVHTELGNAGSPSWSPAIVPDSTVDEKMPSAAGPSSTASSGGPSLGASASGGPSLGASASAGPRPAFFSFAAAGPSSAPWSPHQAPAHGPIPTLIPPEGLGMQNYLTAARNRALMTLGPDQAPLAIALNAALAAAAPNEPCTLLAHLSSVIAKEGPLPVAAEMRIRERIKKYMNKVEPSSNTVQDEENKAMLRLVYMRQLKLERVGGPS